MRWDHLRPRLCFAALIFVASWPAQALGQWTVTLLHPADGAESKSHGTTGNQQVGYVKLENYRASVWSGVANTWASLHPPGSIASYAVDICNGQQVGAAYVGNDERAALWTGSAASWVHLHPFATGTSVALGTEGGQQVGQVIAPTTSSDSRASLWTGTAASWVDLNPDGARSSQAHSVQGGTQVGSARFEGVQQAGMWKGTAASWQSLHPAGTIQSHAYDLDGDQQVGYVTFFISPGQPEQHASLWSGTASSWVDLDPAGSNESLTTAVANGKQVGWAKINGLWHASFWSGTANSWVDLGALLPGSWGHTHAQSISVENNTIYVSGYGYNNVTKRDEAILWTRPFPCACSANMVNLPGESCVVNTADLAALLGNFGVNCLVTPPCPVLGDIDGDNAVTTIDLAILLGQFGRSGASGTCQ